MNDGSNPRFYAIQRSDWRVWDEEKRCVVSKNYVDKTSAERLALALNILTEYDMMVISRENRWTMNTE